MVEYSENLNINSEYQQSVVNTTDDVESLASFSTEDSDDAAELFLSSL